MLNIFQRGYCPRWILLDFEVDKRSKFFIKTSNTIEYIESDVQNIEASSIDDPII